MIPFNIYTHTCSYFLTTLLTQVSSFCFFPLVIIKCKNSLLFDLMAKAVVLVIYTRWIRRATHPQTWFKHGGKTWRKTQKSSYRIFDIPCAPAEIKVSKNEIIKQKTDPYSLGETHDFNSFPSKGYLFWFPLTFTLTHAHSGKNGHVSVGTNAV